MRTNSLLQICDGYHCVHGVHQRVAGPIRAEAVPERRERGVVRRDAEQAAAHLVHGAVLADVDDLDKSLMAFSFTVGLVIRSKSKLYRKTTTS